MSKKDLFGDRMKDYENRFRFHLPRRSYTLMRLDGKSFHSYTSGCKKPFDMELIEDLQETTRHLCSNIMGSVMGYHQSDEISILITDFNKITSESWFDNNLQKLVSVSSSIFTAKFNQLRTLRILKSTELSEYEKYAKIESMKLAVFDSRVWSISDPVEVYNAFVWRQQDCTKNAISMAASAVFSHKELHKLNGNQKQEKLFSEKGINFNDYPTDTKRGALIYKDIEGKWIIDKEIPIFTKDPMFIKSKIPLFDIWE